MKLLDVRPAAPCPHTAPRVPSTLPTYSTSWRRSQDALCARTRERAPVAAPISWKEMETIALPCRGWSRTREARRIQAAIGLWRADQVLPDVRGHESRDLQRERR